MGSSPGMLTVLSGIVTLRLLSPHTTQDGRNRLVGAGVGAGVNAGGKVGTFVAGAQPHCAANTKLGTCGQMEGSIKPVSPDSSRSPHVMGS